MGKQASDRRAVIVKAPSGIESSDLLIEETTGRVLSALSSTGFEYDVIDLTGFCHVLSTAERAAYFGDRPILDPEVRTYADLIKRASCLVFVYEARHSMIPPALKGFLERVMVPGVSFEMSESGKVRRGLRHVEHLIGIAIHDSSRRRVVLDRNPGRRVILRCLRMSASLRTRSLWTDAYNVQGRRCARDNSRGPMSDDERQRFLIRLTQRIERRLS